MIDVGRTSVIAGDLPGDGMLTREQAAQTLTEAGFPTSSAALATAASRGTGPRYARYGRRTLYRWADLRAWAEARLEPGIALAAERTDALMRRLVG